MWETNFVNPKVALFVDVIKKISLQIGSKQIKFTNLSKETYGLHKNKTKNNKIMTKWHGLGMFKTIKMPKDSILTLIKIFNPIPATTARLYGKWFIKRIVSQKRKEDINKNINNSNARNKKFSTK